MLDTDKLAQDIREMSSKADQLPRSYVKSLIILFQDSLRQMSKALGGLTPRDLGFNSYHMDFFRKLTEAAGQSVTKVELKSAWGPQDRYTEHKFVNTLRIVRVTLRDKGIIVKGWEPQTWRIIEGLPLAQALLAQFDDTWNDSNPPESRVPFDEALERHLVEPEPVEIETNDVPEDYYKP